jgi:hypothetical protein
MTREQIERSVLGMMNQAIERFEHGELTIVTLMNRCELIEEWERDRLTHATEEQDGGLIAHCLG